MGLFGGKKKDTNVPSEPGAHYVQATDNPDNLPVATPIQATVVSSAYASSPAQMKAGESVTTTTVYPPGSKQPYANNTALMPNSQTFVTTIPAPGNRSAAPNGTEMMAPHFHRRPVKLAACPSCSQPQIRTRVRTWPNIVTWIACAVLLILFWPICWIPLVCDVFKQTDHFCQSCQAKVGEVGPFGDCCEKRRG